MSKNVEKSGAVDAIDTAFSKVFNRIDHKRLIHEHLGHGINRDFVVWLQSHLTDRTQRVKVAGFLSKKFKAGFGVLQGIHLGLLMFFVYVNMTWDSPQLRTLGIL